MNWNNENWKTILITLVVLLGLFWIIYRQLNEPLPKDEYMWESYDSDQVYPP